MSNLSIGTSFLSCNICQEPICRFSKQMRLHLVAAISFIGNQTPPASGTITFSHRGTIVRALSIITLSGKKTHS
jgi:hypothetical protein